MLPIQFPTDSALVQKAKQGDKAAFGRLFDRHGPRVYHMLKRLTRSEDAAQDLTQETFIAAYTSLTAWRGSSSFSSWLCGIGVRKYAAAQRYRYRQPLEQPLGADSECTEAFLPNDDPFSHYKRKEADLALSIAIDTLSESCRDVFILIRLEKMSYQGVAELLEIPVGTVQSRLNRATQFLHRRLSPLIYGADPVGAPPVLQPAEGAQK